MEVPRDQRPFQEIDWARTTLKSARFVIADLTRGPDPPDCVGMLDGALTGIEVTRLVDSEALKRTRAGNPTRYLWDELSLCTALQERIDDKEAKAFKGGPYALKVLVIWTVEYELEHAAVERVLSGHRFHLRSFDHVVLGLDYHPFHGEVAHRLLPAK